MSGLSDWMRGLRRWSLLKILAGYVVVGWLLMETAENLTFVLGLPEWVQPFTLVLLLVGFPLLLATAVIQGRREDPAMEAGSPHAAEQRSKGAEAQSGAPTPAAAGESPVFDRPAVRRPSHSSSSLERAFTWKNAAAGAVAGLALLVVVTGGWMLMRALGIGPAGTLLARGTLDEREPILLADFENRTGEPELAAVVTEAFRVDLSQSSVVQLLDRNHVREVLDRMDEDPEEALDRAGAREVALREGVQAVIGGEINRVGSGYVLTAEVIGARDGAVLASRRATASGEADLVEAIDELSERVRERIGESLRTIRGGQPLEQVTTADLEALRLYSQAVRALDAAGDAERGVSLLEEAVRRDSAFAMAWRKLGVALSNRSQERARAVEAFSRAYAHRDRLTERERYLTTAAYHLQVSGSREQAVVAYENLLERHPEDPWALNNLGDIHLGLRDYERAEEFLGRAIEVDSTAAIPWTNLIAAQVGRGQLDRARQTLETFAARFPENPEVLRHRAHLNALERRWEEARLGLVALIQQEAASPYWRALASGELAGLETLRGRLDEATRRRDEAVRGERSRGLPAAALERALEAAQTDLWVREDRRAALLSLAAALERHPLDQLPPLDRPYVTLAELYAAAGKGEAAREMLAAREEIAGAEPVPAERLALDRVAALLALAEGDPEGAVEAARRASGGRCGPCGLPLLARAFEAAGRPDSARVTWERYLETPFLWRIRDVDPWHLAAAYQNLGRLYELEGANRQAAAAYARLVELWEEADRELEPRRERARSRARRLLEADPAATSSVSAGVATDRGTPPRLASPVMALPTAETGEAPLVFSAEVHRHARS